MVEPNRGVNSKRLDFTKTQLAVYFIVILLAIDTINPVKIFLHVFPQIQPWMICIIMSLLMLYVFITELKSLLYFAVKTFFQSILSIFFRDVQVVGRDNIPRYGPVIFTSNHANQFIDAVVVLCTCEHKISYLMAEASWKRRIVGDIAWALGVVPVKRPQDSAVKGTGQIQFNIITKVNNIDDDDEEAIITEKEGEEEKDSSSISSPSNDGDEGEKKEEEEQKQILIQVKGINTCFTSELNVGDKIRPPGTSTAFKIINITSDTQLEVDGSDHAEASIETLSSSSDTKVSFDILKRIDQKVVYSKVLDKLASGGTIGIFPEGGSHDRTDLLPLKVGVALIAYSALEKDGLNVPIIPVGLNYFGAYRGRGRVVVEYGQPTFCDTHTLKEYKQGGPQRRKVCSDLLERIEDSMRSVIVSTPNYDTLELVHAARRLYQRKELHASEKQDLDRRFAEGYRRLLLATDGNPPQEWLDMQQRIMAYQKELTELGIRDYQVPGIDRGNETYDFSTKSLPSPPDGDTVLREMRLPYQIAHIIVIFCLAAIPAVFLNLPVGIIAHFYVMHRRKKALAKSKVKIKALDVMLTEKVVLCIVLVPSLWVFYGFCLYFFTNLDGPTRALIIMSLPLFSYMGIVVTEAGMVGMKDIRPFVMRLFPSARRRIAALPATRKQLQIDLRAFIKTVGPEIGEVYYGKKLDWKAVRRTSRIEQHQQTKKEK